MSAEVVTNALIHYGGLALIHGTVLALITWLLSATLLRRSRPATKAALWTVVLVKFLLPPVLPGEMTMSGWVTRAVDRAATRIHVRAESADQLIVVPSSDEPVQKLPEGSNLSLAVGLLLFCYLSVVALLSIRALLALKRTRRRIQALSIAGSDWRDEVSELAERIGLKCAPEVRVTGDHTSPFVAGFRRPVLVLPEGLMQMLEPPGRQALILHELAHIRRRDQLTRYLQIFACILLCFFPPVRWVCRRVERFTEMACDQWAVAVSKVDPYTYASVLVRVVKHTRLLPTAHAELPLVRGVRLLEERLRKVLRGGACDSPRPSSFAKAIMVIWVLFVLAGGAAVDAPKQTLKGSPVAAGEAEKGSDPAGAPTARPPIGIKMVALKDESAPGLPNARREATTEQAATMSKPGKALEQPQSERPDYADQAGERQEKSDDSRQERLMAERRAIESQARQGAILHADNSATSDYEQGFRLARQFAEERARRSTADSMVSGQGKQELRSLEDKTRREIELRARALTAQPPRQ